MHDPSIPGFPYHRSNLSDPSCKVIERSTFRRYSVRELIGPENQKDRGICAVSSDEIPERLVEKMAVFLCGISRPGSGSEKCGEQLSIG